MRMRGVNALNGLSSFLHRLPNSEVIKSNECQRPKRAFFISTIMANNMNRNNSKHMCQRPKRAFFISTKNGGTCDDALRMCVNALNGLSSFLRNRKNKHLF